ncbi:MAG: hypothetical protein MRZ36_08330 [Eubacterium sp.]|nr:hypothetical protein [Eubacterium sp.]
MNKAKKIMKNQGIDSGKKVRKTESSVSSKNIVLITIGILVVLVLCLGTCYSKLRPRNILVVQGNVSGASVSSKLSYQDAMYDIYNIEAQYNSMSALYEQFYGSTFWEATNLDSEGHTGSQLAKKEVMNNLKLREILCLEAEQAGVTLNDDEKKKVETDLDTFMGKLTAKQKKMDGLNKKRIRKAIERQALADKYKEQIIASFGIDEDAIKATVSKEDNRQYTIQYYTIDKTTTDSDGKTANKSDADLKKAKSDIEALQKKAAKAKDFTKDIITDSNNDNVDDKTGISYSTEDLVETDTNFGTADLRKAIKKMSNNTVSDVLETEDAYYVIKMVNNNDSAAYDKACTEAVDNEKETKFDEKYKKDIKPNYTAKAQSYWKSAVKVGYITYDEDASESTSSEE